ncbi:dTDP-4-dehydrorhamnose 3,5-epimerase [Streptomyces gilvosporeus]|uniref:dTDP-4-dehydrorhamnose 3,5-epimerase n=1 Tax=Streptomyces gilvosporeus TaxID=553510 RepID=A0A1V0TK22_9ACTN|nr:dTDP-4-dehydrorhamnose 3,5-epimerase [Streptomyces gilvosporeus]ARF53243.1 dTDP-4-dehydrorhamnose 3,5-epimerase [Streptomyces gilvosporeus]
MQALDIAGAWITKPRVFGDDRGTFHEWFCAERFRESTGHDLRVLQANCSVSRRGVLRGVHFADVPPGQGKFVTCVRGAVLDVVVDIRLGSPTYRHWVARQLDDRTRRALYVAEGLGHAFMALSDDATVVYLCSEGYAPGREHGIHPLDPELGIDWPAGLEPVLSEKDEGAPSLAEAERAGLLPSFDGCQAHYDRRLAQSEARSERQ